MYQTFAPASAWMIAAASIGTIYVAQLGLFGAGVPGLVASAAADVAVIALLVAIARRAGAARIGLTRVAPRLVVAGALLGISAWYLDLRLVLVVKPPGETRMLEGLVEQTALVPTLLAIAVLPAVAEELVFRGVLARALAVHGRAVAIGVSTLVFAAYHLNPLQIVATVPLGLALGYVALRADSAVPTMIAHALNNAVAIVISRDALPGVGAWIGDHPSTSLAGAAALVAAGLVLA